VVVLGPSEKGPYKSVAFWPEDQKIQISLTTITERVLKEQKSIAIRKTSDSKSSPIERNVFQLASPVRIDEKLYGAVALEITERPQNEIQSAIRHLQWGIAWLEKWIISKDTNKNSKTNERLACAVDLVAHTLQEDGFQAATTSFVTLVATSLGCDRVSIGFMKGKSIKVQALSHSAQFKKQMNLIRAICSAMEESVDQQKVLIYPVTSKEIGNDILCAHVELAKQQKHVTICTIPFIDNGGDCYGALTLERSLDKPFDTGVVELCDSITALVAPVLEEKRKNDRLLINKIGEYLCLQVKKLSGPGRMAMKLFTVLSIVMVIFFTFAKGEYRVTAKSTIEGKVQHAMVAPYDGYIFEAYVRAGDSVKNGQVMCKLDDSDFRLEHTKLESQREQYSKQHREAMAVGKRADMKILKEQINQTETQLALLDEQLSRTKLIATFDGLVVSGDLSQSLGAPVERGQVLFEISPLHDYRVRLEVDERQISRINVGQTGNLVLNALPKAQFPIIVEKITPVSTAEEGVSFFLVEAKLDEISERLRPGMEGFGKIGVGEYRLIWIWTHSLTDCLRLWAWSWWP
jgi:RND family efflux transporter MFP subunit